MRGFVGSIVAVIITVILVFAGLFGTAPGLTFMGMFCLGPLAMFFLGFTARAAFAGVTIQRANSNYQPATHSRKARFQGENF